MDVVYKTENSDIATVYIGDFGENRFAEFVESVQPPTPLEKKWVLIISTLFGCPVGCRMCDAGKFYGGKISVEEIFSQIDYPVIKRFPDRRIFVDKFKIQFARMGEPALNSSVLEVLREFRNRYDAPGFIPSISTIAPIGSELFFDELTEIKDSLYGSGNFQMQFSIHSTSISERDNLIPVKKWSIQRISRFGEEFYSAGDKKITLNFVFSGELEINSKVLSHNFDTEKFLIKITPVNPTISAVKNG
ncbi:MAG: radical SAM protein, partial [Candidatus Aminicenantes bacterium]|nr:radical SAM protein [Candidatus Aminicenantes bacterium]